MKRALNWIVAHPLASVFLVSCVIALLTLRIGDLKIDSSAAGLMVQGDPASTRYAEIRERFGSDTLTAVVVESPSGDVFRPETLHLIDDLTRALADLDGVSAVRSLSNVEIFDGETMEVAPLIEEVPEDEEALSEIKVRALADPLMVDHLVSRDGGVAGIYVFTDPPPEDMSFNATFTQEVDRLIEAHRGRHDVFQIGAPLSKMTFSTYIEKDLRTLFPWSMALLLIILLISFRRATAIFLPILTGGLSILATLGFMAWIGFPVTVVTAMVPSILVTVGCTEDVHMLAKYYQEIRSGSSKAAAVRSMLLHSALPITLTSLTTFLGFATLAVNQITILKQFGIVCAFGLAFNYVVTIIFLPAAVKWFAREKQAKKRAPRVHQPRLMERALTRLTHIVSGSRVGIAGITLTLVVLAVVGCFRLEVNNDFISFFKPDSVIRQRIERIHRDLSGALTFNIVVETGKEGGIIAPEVLSQIDALQEFMRQHGEFDKTTSVVNLLKLMNREMFNGDPEMYRVPETQPMVAQYLLLLPEDEVAPYLDDTRSSANIIVSHNIRSSSALDRNLELLDGFIQANWSKDLDVVFTGEWVLINQSADDMVLGQVEGLALAMGAIFLIMSVLFLSFKAGILAMISNLIPIIFNFGLMGWLDIPLNTGTCMLAAIALGIAVDDTIHFMVRYQRELREKNDQQAAMAATIMAEGEPITFTSFALALGFGVLILSNFIPTAQFGLLAALVMIYALLTDLFVNPMILLSVQLITIWDFIRLKLKKDITKESPVFRNLRDSEAKKVVLLGSIRSAAAGEYLFHQGEEGHEMYLVLTGSVKVTLDREGRRVELGTLKPGDVLGEMALLEQGIRSANIIAAEDAELLRIDEASLERVRRRFPKIAAKLFMNLSRVLSSRLRDQNVRSVAGHV